MLRGGRKGLDEEGRLVCVDKQCPQAGSVGEEGKGWSMDKVLSSPTPCGPFLKASGDVEHRQHP